MCGAPLLPLRDGAPPILDMEDFLVSNLLLPLGCLIYLLFCVSRWGWGFDKLHGGGQRGPGPADVSGR